MPMAAPVTKKNCIIYAHYLEQNFTSVRFKTYQRSNVMSVSIFCIKVTLDYDNLKLAVLLLKSKPTYVSGLGFLTPNQGIIFPVIKIHCGLLNIPSQKHLF
ncbi:UNVERIFIED_CONTAM: hypothetical protein K2H54_058493 [Gekko kuhli]